MIESSHGDLLNIIIKTEINFQNDTRVPDDPDDRYEQTVSLCFYSFLFFFPATLISPVESQKAPATTAEQLGNAHIFQANQLLYHIQYGRQLEVRDKSYPKPHPNFNPVTRCQLPEMRTG